VRSDGFVSGGGCAEIRRAKLREEGVGFLSAEQVDMIAHQWDGSSSGEARDLFPTGE
jgi:hypothetical protein